MGLRFEDPVLLVLVGISVLVLTLETSIVTIYGYLNLSTSTLYFKLEIFAVGCSITFLSQSYLLFYIARQKIALSHKTFRNFFLGVGPCQIAIMMTLLIATLQSVFTLSFPTAITTIIVTLSYLSSISILVLMFEKFIRWLYVKRHYILFANWIALVTILINVTSGFLVYIDGAPYLPTNIKWYTLPVPYTHESIFKPLYQTSSILSFSCTWISAVLLLRNFTREFGKIKFWIVVSLALAYFLTQFQPFLLDFLLSNTDALQTAIIYSIVFSVSTTVGAILFGISFWNVARKIKQEKIRKSMRLAAYGMILLFTSNEITSVLNFDFPAFGIIAISFVGLSSFLFVSGLYSSAISVTKDIEMRRSIRRSLQDDYMFMSSMADAEIESSIRRKVTEASKKISKAERDIGIESLMDEKDLIEYARSVIKETRKGRNSHENDL